MKMHALSGGRVRMRRSVYVPEAERGETIELPVSCFLLRHPQGNVLFDTGCHPSVAEDPVAHWGGMAKIMTPIMPPGVNVLTGLAGIGFSADDVDVVVCSHLHPDHCGCNAFFQRATVVVHAKDVAAARGRMPRPWAISLPNGIRRVRPAGRPRDVFGDGQIVLDSVARAHARLDRRAGPAQARRHFLLAADAAPLRITLDEGIVPRNIS